MSLAPGARLTEQLQLIERIGAGAMGSVWLAEDSSLERRVAVKLVAADARRGHRALERFRREANLAAKIKSPHVVEIHGHGIAEDGEPYIVMELLEGQSLASRVKAGSIELDQVCEIVTQAGRALTAAHALGVVHRDIKPANVFLVDAPGYEVFVKVVDFGIAKQREDVAAGLTATGAVIGTPWYMSPEQLTSSKEVDHRADLWALAAMAYELLSGEVPFPGDTIGAVSVAVTKGEFTAISRTPLGLDDFDAWFQRAFDGDIDGRFQNAGDMTRRFDEAFRGLAQAPTVQRPAPARTASDDATADMVKRPVPAGLGDETAATVTVAPDDDAPDDDAADDDAAASEPPDSQRDDQAEQPMQAGTLVPPKRSRMLWALAAIAVLGGLGLWLFRDARSATDSVSRHGPASSTPAATTAPPSTATSSSPPRSTSARGASRPKRSGRLPTGHIREVVGSSLEALQLCLEQHNERKRGLVRTLRFVIAEDGSTTHVHVAEVDPATAELDECLVSKVEAMGFVRPTGGTVTVSYPIVFSDEKGEPLDDSTCRLTPWCRELGRCSAKDGSCVVQDDADCALAKACTRQGQCHAASGRCVASADGGPETAACKNFGLCTVADGVSRAESDELCASSRACRRFGMCRARGGLCALAGSERCRESSGCEQRGSCAEGARWCAAGSDADCSQSESCKSHGWCSHRYEGCAARKDEDCRQADLCRHDGRCTAGKLGRCIATSESDCRKSARCASADRCSLVAGDCVQHVE